MKTDSRLPGFRNQSPAERRRELADKGISEPAIASLSFDSALPEKTADAMIENVVGSFELPMGVATNFRVNGRDYLIPMAVEEPSMVAAASYMARLVREGGGFTADCSKPVMRGQVQILGVPDMAAAESAILAAEDTLIEKANRKDKMLCDLGGGCIGIGVHQLPDTAIGPMMVVHLAIDGLQCQ